jgi:hypothetical protein
LGGAEEGGGVMIDEEDADFVWLAWMGWPGGFVCTAVGLAIVAAVMFFAAQNEADCSKRTCMDGAHPKLMDHECVCVTEPKP